MPDAEMKKWVFDSWALLAFLEDEPSAGKVEGLIARANETQGRLFISGINLGEIWYSLARSRSEKTADQAVVEITNLGFKRVDPDWSLIRAAASFKARFRLAYADCFAAALSKVHQCPVVTGDPEFKQLEQEVQIFWV
jgi:predicted nucleic acid-binding protein